MADDKNAEPLIEDFEVETLYENRVHERLEFTFKVDGEEFKGHFHNDDIHWLNPHPKQKIGMSEIEKIETTIHSLISDYGMSKEVQGLKIKPMFEDATHERQQISLQVQGEEFKGFVHNGSIHWFHPQPQQKLEVDHVEVMESEIHQKVAQHELNNKDDQD